MEANFNKKEGIKKQIRESYGKLVYSYTTHLKFAQLLEKKHSIIKWILIILSASSTCGLLGVLIDWNTRLLAIMLIRRFFLEQICKIYDVPQILLQLI